ncbi:MAG: WD40 repeat domain-containing protein, partial [Candidatus Omnitrophica bacterium]|nr:WD40 repeat domain-containing protein [Candidatus Omnitrophota bacterium]
DRNAALVAKAEANEQRDLAEERRKEADEQRDFANQQLYLIHMKRADEALQDGEYGLCSEELESCPESHRGWEWGSLMNRVKDRFPLHLAGAENPIFTRDGKRLISAGMIGAEIQNEAIVWDLETGDAIREFEHDVRVAQIALGPEEKLLASGDLNGTLKLWDLESGRELWSIQAHADRLDGLQFSPDGQSIASVSWDKFLKVWNVANGELRFAVSQEVQPCKVIFSPDGSRIVVGMDTNLPSAMKILSATSGETLATLPMNNQRTMAYSPDGQWLATGGADGMIRIHDAVSGEERRTWLGHRQSINDLEYSADGGRIVTSGYGNKVNVWDAADGRLIDSLEKPSPVYWLSFNPSGDQVALFSIEHGIRLWNIAKPLGGLTIRAYPVGSNTVVFSSDGQFLASIGGDAGQKYSERDPFIQSEGVVRLWDASNGERISTLDDIQGSCIAFSSKNELAVAGTWLDKTMVKVFDAPSGKLIRTVGESQSKILALLISEDSERMVCLERDYQIGMWDFSLGTKLNRLDLPGIEGSLRKEEQQTIRNTYGDRDAVTIYGAFDREARRAVTAANSAYQIKVWNLNTNELTHSIPTPGAGAYSIAMSPDGRSVALVSGEWSRIINVDGEENDEPIRLHETSDMYSVEFSPDGKQVVTGQDHGVVRVWDAQSGQQLVTLSSGSETENIRVLDVAWSSDGETIAAARDDGVIEIWKLVEPAGESNP